MRLFLCLFLFDVYSQTKRSGVNTTKSRGVSFMILITVNI